MPTVPRYSGQVQEEGIPNVRVNTEAPLENFGGGKAVQEVYGAVFDIAAKAKKDADELAVLEANKKLTQKQTELLYGENGAMNMLGKNAIGVTEKVQTEFDKYASEIGGGLHGQAQVTAFKRSVDQTMQDSDRTLQRHEFAQKREWDNQETQSYIDNERDAAAQAFTDPERVRLSTFRQHQALLQYGQRNGMGDENSQWFKDKSLEASSRTNASVINRMLENKMYKQADAYFTANKNSFTPTDLGAIEKDIIVGRVRFEAQTNSDAIFLKNKNSMSDAFAEAGKIKDDDVKQATLDKLKDSFQLKKMADTERVENLHKSATNLLDKNKGDWTSIPPSMWNQFDEGERSRLISYGNRLRSGKGSETDLPTYQNLMLQAAVPATRPKFMSTNLLELVQKNKLSRDDYDKLFQKQIDLRAGKNTHDDEFDGFLTTNQIVTNLMEEMSIVGDKDKATFMNTLQNDVMLHEQNTKKKASKIEIKNMANDLMKEKVKEHWYQFGKAIYKIQIEDIDKEERDAINQELGGTASESEILYWYRLKQRANSHGGQ